MVEYQTPTTTTTATTGGGTTYIGGPTPTTVLPTTSTTVVEQQPTQQVIDVYEKEVVTQPVIQEVRHHPVTEVRPQYFRRDVYEPPVTQFSDINPPPVIGGTAVPTTGTSSTTLIQPQPNYLLDQQQQQQQHADAQRKENIFSKLKRKISAPKGPMQPGYPTNYYDPNYPYSSSTRTFYDPSTDSYSRTYPLSSLPGHNIVRYDEEDTGLGTRGDVEYVNYRASTPPLGTSSPVSYATVPPPVTTTTAMRPTTYYPEDRVGMIPPDRRQPMYYGQEGTSATTSGGVGGGLKEMFYDLKDKVRPTRSDTSVPYDQRGIPGSYDYGYTRPPRAVPTANYIYGRDVVGGGVPIQERYLVGQPSYGERIFERMPMTTATTTSVPQYHQYPPGLTPVSVTSGPTTAAPVYIRERQPYLERGYPVEYDRYGPDRDLERQRWERQQRELPHQQQYYQQPPESGYLRQQQRIPEQETRYLSDRERIPSYHSDRGRDLSDRERYYPSRDRSSYFEPSKGDRYYDDSRDRQRALEQQRWEDQRLYDQQHRGAQQQYQPYEPHHQMSNMDQQRIRQNVDKDSHPFDQTKNILEQKLSGTSASSSTGYDESPKPRKGKWHASWSSQDYDKATTTKPETASTSTRSKTPDL